MWATAGELATTCLYIMTGIVVGRPDVCLAKSINFDASACTSVTLQTWAVTVYCILADSTFLEALG